MSRSHGLYGVRGEAAPHAERVAAAKRASTRRTMSRCSSIRRIETVSASTIRVATSQTRAAAATQPLRHSSHHMADS
jgi:hypothetical protein